MQVVSPPGQRLRRKLACQDLVRELQVLTVVRVTVSWQASPGAPRDAAPATPSRTGKRLGVECPRGSPTASCGLGASASRRQALRRTPVRYPPRSTPKSDRE